MSDRTRATRVALRWLQAAAKGPDDLPEGWYVEAAWVGSSRVFILRDERGKENAYIRGTGPPTACGGAFIVMASAAKSGWGPMMYDLLMEFAGSGGIMADRQQVTDSAAEVWFYYLRNRRNDVRAHPLWDDPNIRDDHACGYHYPDDSGPGAREALDFRFVKADRNITRTLQAKGLLLEGGKRRAETR